jgi:DNA modification methylase
MHLNNSNGYWYVRRNTSGGKETVAKLGKHEGQPSIYRPDLHQDKAENILSRIPEGSVDAIITDPPYGIDFEWGDTAFDGSEEMGTIANDTNLNFLEGLADQFARVLKTDSHVYIFTRWDAYAPMAAYFSDRLEENTLIVWDKVSHGMGDLSDWAPQHEFIMHFEYGDPDLYGKRPTNVIQQNYETSKGALRVHPTQKPRGLIEFLIEKSTEPGDVVLDPFGGAYTTARAAMRKFRKGISCELDPETHRAAKSLVNKQLRQDPEYAVDWTDITGLNVEQVELVAPLVQA